MKHSSEKIAIGDFAKVISGYAFKSKEFQDDGIPIIKIKNIRVGDIDLGDVQYVKEEYLDLDEKYHVNSGDILISLTGSHLTQPNSVVGRVAKYSGPKALLNQRAGKITINASNKADKDYLYYTLSSKSYKRKLALFASGAASQANISPSQVESVELDLPDLETQQKIASILSAFDDLIENNTQRIAILEEMARLFYREWFVHYRYPGHENDRLVDSGTELGEVPEGWGILEAQELIEFNPRTSIDKDKARPYLPMGGVLENSMVIEDSEVELRIGGSGTKFQNLDTLFARITPSLENGKTGFVQFLNEGQIALGSTEFIVMRSKKLNPYYVYCLARDDKFRETAIKSMAGASGRQRVRVNSIKEYNLPLPSRNVLDAFDRKVKPMFEQIHILTEHNKKLKETRDLLLPKLISGGLGIDLK